MILITMVTQHFHHTHILEYLLLILSKWYTYSASVKILKEKWTIISDLEAPSPLFVFAFFLELSPPSDIRSNSMWRKKRRFIVTVFCSTNYILSTDENAAFFRQLSRWAYELFSMKWKSNILHEVKRKTATTIRCARARVYVCVCAQIKAVYKLRAHWL